MKHLNQNEEFRFNEVLFEHRNKAYGAYALRNESDRILTKSLFIGVGLLAAISITPMIISAFRTPVVVVEPPYFPPPTVVDVDPPKDPPVQVKPQSQQAEKIKTFDNRVPEPKQVVTNEKEVVEHPEKAIASTHTSEGKEVTTQTYIPVAPTLGPGTVGPPQVLPQVFPKSGNEILEGGELGQEASYAGGIDSFRKKMMDNFDGSGFEGSGDVMKTIVTFIVEKDGTISGIKASGTDSGFNSEAIRTIKSIRGAWKPAKNKQGELVRSYFRFPVSMKFE